MADANLSKSFSPTLPLQESDPFRFGQLRETAKDCFQVELQRFFEMVSARYPERLSIVPTIQKFSSSFAGGTDVESVLKVYLQRPDRIERFPIVIITSATGAQNPVNIGTQYVDTVRTPAFIHAPALGPYSLQEGDTLAFKTYPQGPKKPPLVSYLRFSAGLVDNLAAVTVEEVLNIAGATFLYVAVDSRKHTEPTGQLRFQAGGKFGVLYPNSIEIVPSLSTLNALTAFGFTNEKATNSDQSAALRYAISANITVNIDIGAEDENQRREITDLIEYFFQLDMDDRGKTFLGRSVFDIEFTPPELFQCILLDKANVVAEVEVPMNPGSGEQKDLIYAMRMSVPITIFDYIDRQVGAALNNPDPLRLRLPTDVLPEGDYAYVHDPLTKTTGLGTVRLGYGACKPVAWHTKNPA
jgi:hypothetical protein